MQNNTIKKSDTTSLPVVYFYPGSQWNNRISRQRYLMEALSLYRPVIYLNSTTSSNDKAAPYVEQINDRVTVIHNTFSFQSTPIGKRINRFFSLDAFQIHKIFKQLGVDEYIYWVGGMYPNYLPGMRTDRLVYDCIDPCLSSAPGDIERFDADEAAFARRSRMVFSTAEVLYEKMLKLNPNSHLIPNGCEEEVFGTTAAQELPLPAALEGRPGPIIGYMGTFDSRVDTELLTEAAIRLPEYTFALVGRINRDQEERVARLRALPNVIMPGRISYEEGRAYNAAFDIGLIPFLVNAIGDAINPVKMWMYLISGMPVIATSIREARRAMPYVRATNGVEEFVEAIRSLKNEENPEQIAARRAFAMKNTWDCRAAEAHALLKQLD